MKHLEPPHNLPIVDEPSAQDVHFREHDARSTLKEAPVESRTLAYSIPPTRSLQPNDTSMTQEKGRPNRAPSALLLADEVAERLLTSRMAVYRLVRQRRLPVYRLPCGLRFKHGDVEAFVESHRNEASPRNRYGGAKD